MAYGRGHSKNRSSISMYTTMSQVRFEHPRGMRVCHLFDAQKDYRIQIQLSWWLTERQKRNSCLNILFAFEYTTYRKRPTTIMSSNTKFETHGTTAAAKVAGFKDFPSFLISFDLQLDNSDDLEKGRKVLRAIGHGVWFGSDGAALRDKAT